MTAAKATSTHDLKEAARRRLPRIIFDYIEGSAEDELCAARNRAAFDDLQLVPRYLRDVSKVNQSVELFGRKYSSPFGIAPMGMTAITYKDADLLLAEAAHAANVPFILSGASSSSIEKVARIAPTAWYQLYIPRDTTIRADLIKRVADAGMKVLVVTIDVAVYSKRERDIRNGWIRPYNPTIAAKLEAACHPDWVFSYLKNGIPYLENWQKYAPPKATPIEVAGIYAKQSFAVQTWDVLKEIREQWRGPMVLKGVMHPADAMQAVEEGADGLIVSNHGGRQFDRAPSPLSVFPQIDAAVDGRIPVMIDSGVTRGSHIVGAMCMGAQFGFIGRAALYAVAAYGLSGVERVIAILQQEINLALATLGCPDVRKLDDSYLRSTLK
jgi:L-lactate dehydrogenase (cytochrome)/(S)-mandelate dehydrogenase